MGINKWNLAVSGDWAVAANWSTASVPIAGDDVSIDLAGAYTVSINDAEVANTLTVNAAGAQLLESTAGSLTLSGQLTVDDGLVTLNAANAYSAGTAIAGGTLAVGNGGALGSGTLTISGGELLGTATETIANGLAMSGSFTIAAASGTTLTLDSLTPWTSAASTAITFGAPGQDGTVVWHTTNPPGFGGSDTIEVAAGTLQAGDDRLYELADFSAASFTVDAGATLEAGGFAIRVKNLLGSGTVTDSGAAAQFTINGGNFAGSIAGALSIDVIGALTLTGSSSYSGTTQIDNATLTLGDGGTSGALPGASAISFTPSGGTLAIDRSDAFTLANAISGVGALHQNGTGTTTISTANTYSGGTTVSAGTLAVGDGGALGSGTLSLSGGELLGTAAETIANALSMSGSFTIAAATGTTLTLNSATPWTSAASTSITFGAAGQDGTVVWHTTNPPGFGSNDAIEIAAGTLQAGDDRLYELADFSAASFTVDAGATLEAGGFAIRVKNLLGSGTVTDSGAAAQFTINGGNFAGSIAGALSIDVIGALTLTGSSSYSGTTQIDNATLTLGDGGTSGALPGASAISFTPSGGTLAIDRSDAFTLANAISGSGALHQSGTGTTTLTNVDTYSGATTIDAGTLQVDGSIASSAVTVNSGGTLGGIGTTGAVTINSGGAVAPGDSPGILTTGDFALNAGANLDIQIAGTTAGTGYDQVDVTGSVTLAGTLSLSFLSGFVTPNSTTYTIIDNDGTADAVTGTFAGLAEGAQFTAGGQTFSITYQGGDGNDVVVSALNDAPSVTNAGTAVGYAEQAAAVALEPGLTLTDDSANLTRATVTITTGLQPGDMLDFTPQGGITGSYDAATGVLTLTGTASLADYQAVLRSVTFANLTNDNPTNDGIYPSRTIAWQVNDGTAVSGDLFGNRSDQTIDGLPGASTHVDLPWALASGDFNDDGISDLVLADRQSNYVGAPNIVFFSGQAGTGIGATGTHFSIAQPSSVAFADLTGGTGRLDILVTSAGGGVTLFPDGSTTTSATFATGSDPESVAVADLNHDGLPDLAVANAGSNSVSVLLGSGGTLAAATDFAVGLAPFSVAIGDLDGDGNPDLAVANRDSDNVSILLGDGSGGIAAAADVAISGAGPISVALGDFNGDGNLDLVTANFGSANVSVLLGDGTGGFAAPTTYAVTGDPAAVAIGDLNGDGNLDLAVAVQLSNAASVLLGDGSGGFGPETMFSVGEKPRAIAIGDFNGDGAPDLATTYSLDAGHEGVSVVYGQSTNRSAVPLATVNVTAVNDAPTGGGAGNSVGYTEQTAAVAVDSALTVTDPDSPTLASATVTISSGFQSGDVLHFTDQNGIAGSYVGGVLTLSGSATLADYQTALRSVTFDNQANDNPTNYGADTTRTVDWVLNDGGANSTIVSSTIAITASNDAPTATASGGTTAATEQIATAIDAGLTVSDVDSATLASATVSITGNFQTGEDVLAADTTGTAIAANYTAATGILSLTGLDTLANYLTVLHSVTYTDTSDTPNVADRTVSFVVNDGTVDSSTTTKTVSVTAVDDPSVAKNDAVATMENVVLAAGDAFANNGSGADSDPEGDAFVVTAVDGNAGAVGNQIMLASGALLTLNTNGTFSYDPNHAFDYLPDSASGGSNLTADDTFTYTITGGSTATVTVTVSGVDSNDTIRDTPGVDDNLSGGAGNDIYYIHDAGDLVNENSGEGTDTIFSTVDYTLPANVENLGLRGSAANVTGNGLGNTLYGNYGVDTLTGGDGNDVYYIRNGADQIVEGAGPDSGKDVVYAFVDYTLPDNVETLVLRGAGDLSGTGNALDNLFYSNTDIDTLAGGDGNDTYLVHNSADSIVEDSTPGSGTDIVYADVAFVLPDNVENLRLIGSGDLSGGGNALANIFYSNAGVDTLTGGDGNDIYYIHNSADGIVENGTAGAGIDTVYADVSYTLPANVENLILTGSANLSGTGNALDNVIYSNSGIDTLTGGDGNDLYLVHNGADTIVEGNGASSGTDTVYADVSFTLSLDVENLTLMGSGNLNGTGNALDNVINSNAGIDTLTGGDGNDIYVVRNSADQVVEAASGGTDQVITSVDYALAAGSEVETLTALGSGGTTALTLSGNAFANHIVGNAGDNVIAGGGGNDTITTYGGHDTIVFDTALDAATNVDQIVDFDPANDTMQLASSVFTQLSAGPLPADEFVTGTAAQDGNDYIIYDDATGVLSYDADGSGGGTAAVQFATLATGLALTHSDFVVI